MTTHQLIAMHYACARNALRWARVFRPYGLDLSGRLERVARHRRQIVALRSAA